MGEGGNLAGAMEVTGIGIESGSRDGVVEVEEVVARTEIVVVVVAVMMAVESKQMTAS